MVRSEEDVALINDTLSAFTRAATARVNSAKTKLLDLRPEPHALRQVSPHVKTDKLRTLGIGFMQYYEQMIKCDWDSVVHNIRCSLLTARLRNINIIQRAYITLMTDASYVIAVIQHFIVLPVVSIPVPYGPGVDVALYKDLMWQLMTYMKRQSAALV
ncbi:hypothetical protein PR048_014760 [Dryococelus australis]|uniref:Uncharacterized protein n=1 Tax=Dryococelus australis TaxID=614101 RepID=A0ABQ9HFH3_9NEOP|nr:hypothetical protein PR048_014760 [Dryococelus australis]